MLKKRLIACLIIKDGLLVQSIGFKKYLPIGNPKFTVEFVSRWDVDEIVILDITAREHNRVIDTNVLKSISKHCFVPLSVGGGIRNLDHVKTIISMGADKIVLNSEIFKNKRIITDISSKFGSQCVVVSIDVKKENGKYFVYSDGGTKKTKYNPALLAKEVENLGAGEIFLNSIDLDGSKKGYDLNLISIVAKSVDIPIIAIGGAGEVAHFKDGIISGGASAVAAANMFHYIEHSTIMAKANLKKFGINVRLDSEANYQDREFDDQGRLVTYLDKKLDEIELRSSKKRFI